jgi:putative nucleotidyltransferase with HDIG domain
MELGMNQADTQAVKTWFSQYVYSFKSSEKEDFLKYIVLKEDHSLRVCQEILELGRQLGLQDNELSLAEIIALLHDIGRFEQYARYKTFMDRESEDHAELGVKVLQAHHVLNNFSASLQDLILRVISYHNQATVTANETTACVFYTQLLRDADKLDIWRVLIEYYCQEDKRQDKVIALSLPDTPGISEHVYNDLIAGKAVDIRHLNNLNDLKLFQISWIYDVNFPPTFQAIKERRYLDLLYGSLPQSEKTETIFNGVQAYLEQEISQECKL